MDRSAYDRFMLRFHDYLKENTEYQTKWPKIRMEFPPGSTWMVYTDQVPHAAMSGQFMTEQTFIIPGEGDGDAGAVPAEGFGEALREGAGGVTRLAAALARRLE